MEHACQERLPEASLVPSLLVPQERVPCPVHRSRAKQAAGTGSCGVVAAHLYDHSAVKASGTQEQLAGLLLRGV